MLGDRQCSSSYCRGAGVWAQSITARPALAAALSAPGSATKGSCILPAWGAAAGLAAQSPSCCIQVGHIQEHVPASDRSAYSSRAGGGKLSSVADSHVGAMQMQTLRSCVSHLFEVSRSPSGIAEQLAALQTPTTLRASQDQLCVLVNWLIHGCCGEVGEWHGVLSHSCSTSKGTPADWDLQNPTESVH